MTDANGEINIEDLEPGVYSVQETKAPEGYVIDPTEYHVELFPGQVSELVVSNDRKPNLEIVKTDAVTGSRWRCHLHGQEGRFLYTDHRED